QDMALAVQTMDIPTLEGTYQELLVRHAGLQDLKNHTKGGAAAPQSPSQFGQWAPENFAARSASDFTALGGGNTQPMMPAGIRGHWAHREAPRLRQGLVQGDETSLIEEDPEATMNDFMAFRMVARQDISAESPEVGVVDTQLQQIALRSKTVGDTTEVSSNDIHEQARLKRLG
ncbi:MAG: hypothetical protein Q8K36_03470, partial [Alphaproteobacteria bacterium]|nr:hypothetical protein [Alphaproteobacteria bacterium]